MPTSIEKVEALQPVERRKLAEKLMSRIARGHIGSMRNYANLARGVMHEQRNDGLKDTHKVEITEDTPEGIFSANGTISFVNSTRTQRFVKSIQAQEVAPRSTIIDAGTGATALLAVAAATANPMHEVLAVEYNHASVQCARRMVELLGLPNIEVVQGDIFKTALPNNIGLGITETFYCGLQKEMGTDITHYLATAGARALLPAFATIHARIGNHKDHDQSALGPWHKVQYLNLADHNPVVSGSIPYDYRKTGQLYLFSRASYYDQNGGVILDNPFQDTICSTVNLGSFEATSSTQLVDFSYRIGRGSIGTVPFIFPIDAPMQSRSVV